jgi:hypothetical protein
MSELEPLPDELAELFAAERAAPVANTATRTALRSRLTAAAAPLLVGKAAAAATALGTTGKVLAILALTLGAGAGTVALVKHRDDAVARAPVHQTIEAPPSLPRRAEHEPVEPEQPAEQPPAPTPPRHPHVAAKPVELSPPAEPPPEVTVVEPSPSQAQMLKRAWAALAAGAPAQALELARADQQDHPAGELAEERDALVIQALVKLARADEARQAATAFFARYPTSIHRTRIEQLVAQESP